MKLKFVPLTPARWPDFETLFGSNGACAGCWCMYWRLSARDYERGKGESNHQAMKALVKAGQKTGLLAYAGKEAVGWLALEPRAAYPRLEKSRILAPLDERPVWSVSCFFIKRGWRGQGVSAQLLQAAVEQARRAGVKIVEGYPVDRREKTADTFVWTGLASTFRKCGFKQVARRSATRPIMRMNLT